MREVVRNHSLAFVASVNEDGTPNLSPKATMLVLDDEHIAFGHLRSPNTVRNLKSQRIVELNFVDIFARRGFRFKGPATYIERDTKEFHQLVGNFSRWGELAESFLGIIVVKVDRALPITSPAYDHGADEAGLREQWREQYLKL